MKSEDIMKLEDGYQLDTYKKLPVAIVRGSGAEVFDAEGKRYLDFYSGHAVTITGHCHPKVVAAIKEQAEKLIFYSNVVYNDIRAEAAERIVSIAPKNLTKVFFSNSGAESNEVAMKMVRRYTDREEIISMSGSFHGRTTAAMSATGLENYKLFRPLLTGFKFAEFGNIENVKKLINENTAAVICEPVQSMAGVVVAKEEFYKELREICTDNNIILIFDEVQTFARTGKMFACEQWGIEPDIINIAKGVASGIPMGATLISKRIAETIKTGEHGSTFGGGPIACAAACATIDIIEDEKLLDNARLMGNYIKSKLTEMGIKTRGFGLLLGIESDKDVQKRAFEKGLILGSSEDPKILRLMPPLIINKSIANEAMNIIKEVLP